MDDPTDLKLTKPVVALATLLLVMSVLEIAPDRVVYKGGPTLAAAAAVVILWPLLRPLL